MKIFIDGKEIDTPPGSTILEAAQKAGIHIPTLCYHKQLSPYGGCRVCIVQVEGIPRLVASCTTPATEGMVVRTDSEQIRKNRKTVVELILSNHPNECMVCEQNGRCELQDLAYEFGLKEIRFKGEKSVHPLENQNPLIERDYNKCILCGRCVRMCDEIQGVGAVDFSKRGFYAKIATEYDGVLKCEFCGNCVEACPVGALTGKISRFRGRSWEARKVKTICNYCGCGCSLMVHAKDDRIVRVSHVERECVNEGFMCVKGKFGFEYINHEDRLKTPLIKKNGEFVEASWDEALDTVARNLTRVRQEYGPNSVGGLCSAKCTNEDNYVFQKFMRTVIGTNNVDHCARYCHSSTVAGLVTSFGSGAMTNSISEFEHSDAYFVIGSNTTEAHPIIALKLKRGARYHGAKLVVADPREIPLTRYATLWLRHKPGTDAALLNGLMHIILKEGLEDKAFIEERTENLEALKKVLKKYTPAFTEKVTGVPGDKLAEAARIIGKSGSVAFFYAMGITQHVMGTENVMSVANLAMLTGNVGRPGVGVNPLRGQSNVQGACDMGGLFDYYPGYQRVDLEENRKKFSEAWTCDTLSREAGLPATGMIDAAVGGKLKALYVMGENPLLSDPDIGHTEKAFENLEFLVVQDIFMTETAALADVVLPASSFVEKDGTFTNTERRVQRVCKVIDPLGQCRVDWEILADLSARMGRSMSYKNTAEIMDEIASVTPLYGGISHRRLEKGGLQWPCPDANHPGTTYLHKGKFTRGKGFFFPVDYRPPAELPDAGYPFLLTTGRMLSHYHTGTMTRRSKGLDELCPEGFMEIHPSDARRLQVTEGEAVRVTSRRGAIAVKVQVTRKVPPSVVYMNFHFAESPANRLTIAALDPRSGIAEAKVCAVRIEKLIPEEAAVG